MAAMADTITDEMLEQYAASSTWAELPATLVRKYRGKADRLIFYFADAALNEGADTMDKWRKALAKTRALCAAACLWLCCVSVWSSFSLTRRAKRDRRCSCCDERPCASSGCRSAHPAGRAAS